MTIIQNRTLPAGLKGFKKLKFRLSSLNLNIAGTVALKTVADINHLSR
jgi:hypothetical protein